MSDLAALASALKSLHVKGDPVVLPTVWDAWSARSASSRFAALTVGSHPLAESIGRADGEGMTFSEAMSRVSEITRAVHVPVSVDIESGYGEPPAVLIDGLLAAGAVGLNIEDTVHKDGDRLRDPQEHADLIAALRAAADAAEVPVVINARTDVILRKIGDPAGRVADAIARLTLCAEAGADSLYPVGYHDDEVQRRLADELPLPVNAIAHPATGDLAHLASLGVGRISFGPLLQSALAERAAELFTRWE
ncbi:PEP phosphonomutase OS=Tsukamurella paurometabola (strain ATCC 8368 / DSM/ CCUG 35730 / CIP 100753 / JCM 10117 / KCTC 9821 / NBRC 16120/ NCIMB 702349 / NCTC 13040) OX=521096 GN=Tpau_1447 PE=4 SV=1 [Tsukamurella paurometabola]|uniref:PEP phosphonomutase and related enzymes n=1 Tax=Tsukamurella paurometabola (strain ATCC 8368 / DSM 20162 / CCUG 35730 / CIP 100753 / JCM 10117 / KCTC 9821 / NBRC 16120 / NCIMB 702349 / NCTC 13040) TaxID=521096 RepID=D5UXI2_TSUPD|nr:isocitrate lyase/phosphoenolpyruvate mutase family protein [Tsukamurella paurometabola]ADG78074.1 PEP phosphonomutase and related enzymes [Tsukamurella paurometabola DSM 20162]SUP30064.1 Methylisocitrate lyase [Tsukamurella paurometabola]